VGIFERLDGQRDDRFEPIERVGGPREIRPSTRSGLLTTGTLACPSCDAPVSPGGTIAPSDPLACPLCDQAGYVRDFLSLEVPTRPARVDVWLVARPPRRTPARSTYRLPRQVASARPA
jgi:hypothetical protein